MLRVLLSWNMVLIVVVLLRLKLVLLISVGS